ncbi:MAG: hypothetical protein V4520_12550 [Bacteroidota bacterium]
MKKQMCKFLLVICLFIINNSLIAQSKLPQLTVASNSAQIIARIQNNKGIDADSVYKLLNNFDSYPNVNKTGTNYSYFFDYAGFGKVPLQVYIPANYNNKYKSPCIVMLHGAVSQSKFSDIDSTAATDEDILFDILKKQDYIIIRPLGDGEKKFDWVVNRFSSWQSQAPNLTYPALNRGLISLKKILNIDDNRVFALGHSDGADGALGLAVYTPDAFAGVVAYNAMMLNLSTKDFFIKNIVNRPLYIVHSDLDDLRSMQQVKDIVSTLKTIDDRILYKEYIGYEHYDKHLTKDLPRALDYIKGISRNPYQANLNWETSTDTIFNGCNWLKITKADTTKARAHWQTDFNVKAYDRKAKKYYDMLYYRYVTNNVEVKASFQNNIFEIQTSRVGEVEVLISPVMVNLEQPVIVILNGKQVFANKIATNKNFLLRNFSTTHDRQALWVNSLKVKVE